MKALTVWQPWASLIIEGAKPYEFRGWRAPRSMIGQRIVIHAGARPMQYGEVEMLIIKLRRGGLVSAETCLRKELALEMLMPLTSKLNWARRDELFPRSVGRGTAIIGEPRNGYDVAEEFGLPHVNDSDRDEHANWGWPMLEIEKWPEPVPMKGAQGFWNWPTPAEAML